MTIFETYGKEIVALVVPLITVLLNGVFRSKAKVQYALPHQFNYIVHEPLIDPQTKNILRPTQSVQTNSFFIRNAGREAATNLELVFNYEPKCLNIWPLRHCERHVEPDGRYVMIFASLAPKETIIAETLTINSDPPALITVRCDQCAGERIAMYPQPVVGSFKRNSFFFLLLLGMASAVYIAILVIQFLVIRTP